VITERVTPSETSRDYGTASLGDLIKSTVRSFFPNGNSLSAFQLKSVARLAAPRLLVALQAPMFIHFYGRKTPFFCRKISKKPKRRSIVVLRFWFGRTILHP
jgi:hypothetical protein